MNGWQTKSLGDVCTLKSGTTVDKTLEMPIGSLPYLKVADMNQLGNEVEIVSSSRFLNEADVRKSSILPVGTTIFPKRGGAILTNKKRITAVPICADLNIMGVIPSKVLASKFLYFYFLNVDMRQLGSGSSIPQINNPDIEPLAISFPQSLAEQNRIVGILEAAFDGIATAKANAENNLQNARTVLTSHLQSVFSRRGDGWVEKRLSEISKHSLGKMLDKAKNRGKPQPYLRNLNVRWFTFDLSDLSEMLFLPEETDKYTAVMGDVLVCEGGYPGRAAVWNEDYPIHFQKALHRVRFHDPEHSKWFVYYLFAQEQSGELKDHFTGTGIQHFTGEALADFWVPVAPHPQLIRLVAEFDALAAETQRLESIYQHKLNLLEELKKSLLNQAFSGRL